jgi:DNA-binding NarL/FixJ family response regulator
MAEERLSVLIALADRQRAAELAAHFGESEGILAALADEVNGSATSNGAFDAVVTDDPRRQTSSPVVLVADQIPSAATVGTIRAVLRPTSGDQLIAAAVRLAAAGYDVAQHGERSFVAQRADHAELLPAISLTHREREVIALLAEGASNKLIARRLDISVHTAKFHVAAILDKLGAVNRTDAIAIAMREGLVLV